MKSMIFCNSSQHKMRVSMCYISCALVGVAEVPGYLGYHLQSLGNHLSQSYLAEDHAPHVRLKQDEFISEARMD